MNRRIGKSRAILYVILFYTAVVCLILGRSSLFNTDRQTAGREVVQGTVSVRLDQQVQQVFLAEGTNLRYLDLYVTSEESAGERYHLLLYDAQNNRLVDRDVDMPETPLPGFWRIPIGVSTTPGDAYVWQLQGTDTPVELAYENTGDTGLVTFGNYYLLHDGETRMQTAQNIVMRLTYTDHPSAGKLLLVYGSLLLTALLLIVLTRRVLRPSGQMTLSRLLQLTLGPVLLAGGIFLVYEIFVRNLFGGRTEDKLVYAAGIGIAAAWAGWALFGKRKQKETVPFRALLAKNGMDWLQTACFAGALMGTIHFMNAQFQARQDLAYREVLFWVCLVLLTMGPVRALKNRWGLIWLVFAGSVGTAFYLYQKYGVKPEKTVLSMRLYEILIAILAGFLLLSLRERIQSGRFSVREVNRPYALATALLLFLLAALRNTRGWPLYLAAVFGLFYLFYLSWEKRDRLLYNFCNGVILNFTAALLFALARRPFRAWVYFRYNFVFHTVTITAYYLTLVLCALTVRLLAKRYLEKEEPIRMWGTLLLYGIAGSLLFLTLSRTGYLAVIVMSVIVVPFAVLFCFRQGIKALFQNVLLMAAALLLCLPVTYTGIRILPALYNDPYLYEVEDSAAAIHRDDPKDSSAYMSVSYFRYMMRNKLLGEEETKAMAPLRRDGLTVTVSQELLASRADSELSDVEQFSNGRMEIFKRYLEEVNWFGHTDMGVVLADGSVSIHAHNTYLQVIHDHGLVAGIVYLVFGAVSAILLFGYARRNGRRDPYAILPVAVLIGYAVAGLVEWLFHPCNPMGFSVMVIFAPLLCKRKS